LFLRKNADIFAENWQKSPKIMIITSIPVVRFWLDRCIICLQTYFHFVALKGKIVSVSQAFALSNQSPDLSVFYRMFSRVFTDPRPNQGVNVMIRLLHLLSVLRIKNTHAFCFHFFREFFLNHNTDPS
jgi:hypothetical protein